MNKQEFLNALAEELPDFSAEERAQALQFYAEYFEEAGAENEDAVLQELGSPQKVAQILRANCRDAHAPAGDPVQGTHPQGSADSCGFGEGRYKTEPAYSAYDDSRPLSARQSAPNRVSGLSLPLIIFLLFITFPIWFSVGIAVLSIVFSLFVTLLALIVAGICTAGAGIICLFSCIRLFFVSASAGVLMLGMSLSSIGIGIFMTIGFSWLLSKAWLFTKHCGRSLRQYISLKLGD